MPDLNNTPGLKANHQMSAPSEKPKSRQTNKRIVIS